MNYKYKFYEVAYNHFLGCTMEVLERDIERSQLGLMGKTMFRNVREERAHRGCLDRLDVLKLILRLRKGEIKMADFQELVKITR